MARAVSRRVVAGLSACQSACQCVRVAGPAEESIADAAHGPPGAASRRRARRCLEIPPPSPPLPPPPAAGLAHRPAPTLALLVPVYCAHGVLICSSRGPASPPPPARRPPASRHRPPPSRAPPPASASAVSRVGAGLWPATDGSGSCARQRCP